MRWLPRLLSHAAAAGRASTAARSTTSHVSGGSHGFASGGWEGSPAVPREWLRKLWREELRKLKEAARSYESVEAAGAATEAPSRSYQYDDRDLDPVEASGNSDCSFSLCILISIVVCGNICFDPMLP